MPAPRTRRILGVIEDLALVLDPTRLRVALGVALGEIVFLRMEGSEPAAGREHEVGLPVDMVVADAHGRNGEAHARCPPSLPVAAQPRPI